MIRISKKYSFHVSDNLDKDIADLKEILNMSYVCRTALKEVIKTIKNHRIENKILNIVFKIETIEVQNKTKYEIQ